MTILDAQVSVFNGSFDTAVVETVPLGTILDRIQDGTYKAHVERLRHILARDGKESYTKAKEKSLSFTPCCSLTTRAQDVPWDIKLLACTGILHLDLDELEDPEALKQRLALNPHLAIAFTSPKGNGLKIGFAAAGIIDHTSYKQAWTQVVAMIQYTYPTVHVNVDKHVKFLHALCYVSDDAGLYVNRDPTPIEISPTQQQQARATAPSDRTDYAKVMQALYCIPNNDADYNTWLDLGMALHSTGESWARSAWDAWSRMSGKFDEAKQAKSWRSFTADGKTTIATLFHLAKHSGWRPPRLTDTQERQTRTVPDMTGSTAADEAHHHQNGTHARAASGEPAGAHTPTLVTTCAADVTSKQVQWLWYPYIAHSMLCMVDGDPGTGKSLLLTQLAATLSRGYDFPDQCGRPGTGTRPPQNVLLMTREDSPSMTIRPRLDADKADVARVFIASTWLDVEGKEQAFTLKHLPLLAAELQGRPYALVVLDPIQSFFGDADMHRANQTRPLMDGLAALAETFQCAIVCVRHAAKPGEGIGKAMLRGLGSVDIVGAARTAVFVEQYPGDETRALMAQTKSNLGPKGRTQIFSKQEGVFAWERASRLTDEDLAGSGRGPNHRAFLEAVLWLEKRLEGDLAWNATDIEQEAVEQDIGSSTLKRAKKALRVVSAQIKGDVHQGWTWRLPPLQMLNTTSPSLPPTDSSGSTEFSETTDTPDYKTTTYGNGERDVNGAGIRGSVGPEAPEVSGVSVAQGTVPPTVDARVNTVLEVNMSPLQPPTHCPGCGIVPAWLLRATYYECHKCHTEAPRGEVQP